jgi:hypothetical protein
MIAVADPQWKEGVVESEVPEGTGFQVGDWNRFYDTVVDVIDVRTRRLVASIRRDEFWWGIGPGMHTSNYFEEDGILPKIEVWHLHLGETTDARWLLNVVDRSQKNSEWVELRELLVSSQQSVRWNESRAWPIGAGWRWVAWPWADAGSCHAWLIGASTTSCSRRSIGTGS